MEKRFNGAAFKLQKELKGKFIELSKNDNSSFSVGLEDEENIFEWTVTLFGPPDTDYEGGMFKAVLKFPHDYPFEPPTMRFVSQMWHPNIYEDGRVCISILHSPVHDSSGYEDISERWNPAQTVETILVSVLSMLSNPNDESPANVDAAIMWRSDKTAYKRKVQRCVERSMEDL
ncbi:Ubiquitin-conjugating enzyme E2 7 [Coemansia sp. RSA 989]|nr:ubiquitin-conjugating enzyme/RWD-like protein [Coemansia mojavensis]KAJ1740576.1 Ubiquitin-conjugating enzyme E2 7 [Coemansia sp. RSA 1086]KAJ1748914.1 Ubiquitin-conjugating enzyme E2 7 [Coemansia sp. RSA 1821]KAJ1863038.1 Ubiquitin-conjugating enzyme E2 7 [Coemansia sp. RSA 989]KAJ1870884.1 Ubiquitin-conjugating enzyme E2 7 [Coemansia sp. RSA 990]KAJ2627974.1 Ubiquitin-conjugating enzyme E2 7 [Coemansia sp. RSA 1290]KAJ2646977.1 Ubiquitin-conjugating enzyme E2 7 [Coemansia sp. RSA 1250]K